jgi:pimeloyl-ACP methyl ester carboxylesterase
MTTSDKKRMQWHEPPQRHLDTVVFVHGILGDHLKTWGKFPELLTADDDLPVLDILVWGYRTGWFRRHHKLHLEGGHLLSALEGYVGQDNDIVLVGHSMGGLVILKGLIDRMRVLKAAQKPPCHAVHWIILIACPLSGVWFAGIVTSPRVAS